MSKVLLLTEEEFSNIIENVIRKVIEKLPKRQDKDLLSYEEAAEFLDIKTSTLTRQVNDGLYKKHISASGKPYVSRKEILKGFQ